MSKRARYTDKEIDQMDRLKYENKKLKKQLTALRRVLSRVDLARYDQLQDLVEKQGKEQKRLEKEETKEKESRQCFECKEGHMELKIWNTRDAVRYNRVCNLNCGNRTRMKKHHKDVKP